MNGYAKKANVVTNGALTADGGAVGKGLHDVRVHVNRQVLSLDNLDVPCLNPFFDPLLEWFTDASEDDVHHKLLR